MQFFPKWWSVYRVTNDFCSSEARGSMCANLLFEMRAACAWLNKALCGDITLGQQWKYCDNASQLAQAECLQHPGNGKCRGTIGNWEYMLCA
jgi:hypothetical protein